MEAKGDRGTNEGRLAGRWKKKRKLKMGKGTFKEGKEGGNEMLSSNPSGFPSCNCIVYASVLSCSMYGNGNCDAMHIKRKW